MHLWKNKTKTLCVKSSFATQSTPILLHTEGLFKTDVMSLMTFEKKILYLHVKCGQKCIKSKVLIVVLQVKPSCQWEKLEILS